MPSLKNPRHEKFALALSEGKSASQAYIYAGYRPCRQNAARLMTFDDIQARVAEIQGAAAKSSETTIESLLAELEQARERATTKDQMAAAVRAIMGKAQLAGLLVEKSKVEVSGIIEYENCTNLDEFFEKSFWDIIAPENHALVRDEDFERWRDAWNNLFDTKDAIKRDLEARAGEQAKLVQSVGHHSQYAIESRRPVRPSRA